MWHGTMLFLFNWFINIGTFFHINIFHTNIFKILLENAEQNTMEWYV